MYDFYLFFFFFAPQVVLLLPCEHSVMCFQGMKNREERSKHFFDSGPLMEEDEDLAVYDKVLTF